MILNNYFALFVLVSTLTLINTSIAGNVVCYFTSWTIYRPEKGKYSALDTDPKLCTHINYAFVGLSDDGTVRNMDTWESDPNGLNEIDKLISLKRSNPELKVLVSMGGWNEGSERYSKVAADPKKRATLVKSVLDFLDKYKFDGFDLDWEYPNQRGGKVEDRKNFIKLLGDLNEALQPKGKLLTAAVAGSISSADLSYNFKEISKYLDMINVMAYDFHGSFESYVGHFAPLYASHLDKTKEQRNLNVAAGLEYWLSQGVDAKKINLGIGTYGRGFTLANQNNDELYAPSSGPSKAGPYTRQAGILGYNEISELYSKWEYVWDDEQHVPHIKNGNQWIGYEDIRSMAEKGNFAKSKGIGGIMIWTLDTDDFRGISGNGTFPLINAAKKAFNN